MDRAWSHAQGRAAVRRVASRLAVAHEGSCGGGGTRLEGTSGTATPPGGVAVR